MFIERPEDRTIAFTFFGNPHAMPTGGPPGVGDIVTLHTAGCVLEVKITSLLGPAHFRGSVLEIEPGQVGQHQSFAMPSSVVVGASLEFEVRHVHRCARGGV